MLAAHADHLVRHLRGTSELDSKATGVRNGWLMVIIR